LDKNGTFNLNWRLVADPIINNRALELDVLFDVGAK
jgi:hypothetical protein